ncbi:MAG: hypothetical protein QOJ49_739, partial [Actinomycetota bacterium]|nr:hypothetical protein [Actinomycetota bacterium]
MRRNSRSAALAATTIGLACALLLSAAPGATDRAEAVT